MELFYIIMPRSKRIEEAGGIDSFFKFAPTCPHSALLLTNLRQKSRHQDLFPMSIFQILDGDRLASPFISITR